MISILQGYSTMLFRALGYTLVLTVLALIFAMIIGLIFALMNVSHNRILNIIGTVYVDAIRGVPLIVLAFFIYFGVPQAFKMMGFTSFRLPALQAGTIALAMNCGAYMAEIFRAGIESIDKGQMEASRSLGLTYGTSMKCVILPQAFKVMIPSIINQFIITLKDTSILSVIGFPELVNTAKNVVANTFMSFQTWGVVAIMYLIIILALSRVAKIVEKKMNKSRGLEKR